MAPGRGKGGAPGLPRASPSRAGEDVASTAPRAPYLIEGLSLSSSVHARRCYCDSPAVGAPGLTAVVDGVEEIGRLAFSTGGVGHRPVQVVPRGKSSAELGIASRLIPEKRALGLICVHC